MKKHLLKFGIASSTALMLVACGGGGSSDSTPSDTYTDSKEKNTRPIAQTTQTANYVMGGKKLTLDASGSIDKENNIVKYEWFENDKLLGSGMELPYLFSDGSHNVTLKVTDAGNLTDTATIKIVAECMNAEPLSITNDITKLSETEKYGTLNSAKNPLKTYCYQSDLSSNRGQETYTFYMALLSGTSGTGGAYVTLMDSDGEKTDLNPEAYLSFYKAGHSFRKEIPIREDGKYYILLKRNFYTNYAVSLHPSIENGLKQNDDMELNDNEAMAAPLAFDENNTIQEIEGTLHMTTTRENSLYHSDDADVYIFEVKDEGVYTFYMNLLTGTEAGSIGSRVHVALIDESGVETPITDDIYEAGHHIRKAVTLQSGTYYLDISRPKGTVPTKYAFSLYPSVANGLVQNDDMELNDNEAMAAPITVGNGTVEINGTLNVTRTAENSLKGTDDIDMYRLVPTVSGDYLFEAKPVDYHNGRFIHVKLIDANGVSTPIGDGDLRSEKEVERSTISLDKDKTYYLQLDRSSGATGYTVKITK